MEEGERVRVTRGGMGVLRKVREEEKVKEGVE